MYSNRTGHNIPLSGAPVISNIVFKGKGFLTYIYFTTSQSYR